MTTNWPEGLLAFGNQFFHTDSESESGYPGFALRPRLRLASGGREWHGGDGEPTPQCRCNFVCVQNQPPSESVSLAERAPPASLEDTMITIKSLSLSCRPVFFLSIVKTIRSEWAESFSLRQRVQYLMDANEGDAPVRKITNGQKQKTLLPARTEEL